jgi:hypothetical protein
MNKKYSMIYKAIALLLVNSAITIALPVSAQSLNAAQLEAARVEAWVAAMKAEYVPKMAREAQLQAVGDAARKAIDPSYITAAERQAGVRNQSVPRTPNPNNQSDSNGNPIDYMDTSHSCQGLQCDTFPPADQGGPQVSPTNPNPCAPYACGFDPTLSPNYIAPPDSDGTLPKGSDTVYAPQPAPVYSAPEDTGTYPGHYFLKSSNGVGHWVKYNEFDVTGFMDGWFASIGYVQRGDGNWQRPDGTPGHTGGYTSQAALDGLIRMAGPNPGAVDARAIAAARANLGTPEQIAANEKESLVFKAKVDAARAAWDATHGTIDGFNTPAQEASMLAEWHAKHDVSTRTSSQWAQSGYSGGFTTQGGQVVTASQIKDFMAQNPSPDQISKQAAALGMNDIDLKSALNSMNSSAVAMANGWPAGVTNEAAAIQATAAVQGTNIPTGGWAVNTPAQTAAIQAATVQAAQTAALQAATAQAAIIAQGAWAVNTAEQTAAIQAAAAAQAANTPVGSWANPGPATATNSSGGWTGGGFAQNSTQWAQGGYAGGFVTQGGQAVTTAQIQDFIKQNPSPDQIQQQANALGMSQTDLNAAMGLVNR